jgi:HEAT repeat protein
MRLVIITFLMFCAGCIPENPSEIARRKATAAKAPKPSPFPQLLKEQLEQLQSNDAAVRIRAVREIAAMGPKAKPAYAPLISLLNDKNADVATSAQNALIEMNLAAIAMLEQAKKDDNRTAQKKAEELLLEIQSGLENAAKGTDAAARDAAISVTDRVVQRLKADNPLAGVDVKQASVIPMLVNALMHNSPDVRLKAVHALAEHTTAARTAVDGVCKRLAADADVRVRAAAAECIAAIDAHAAIPALTNAVRDPDVQVRLAAIKALGSIGPAAKDAIPVINEALVPSITRDAAYEAIKKIRETK